MCYCHCDVTTHYVNVRQWRVTLGQQFDWFLGLTSSFSWRLLSVGYFSEWSQMFTWWPSSVITKTLSEPCSQKLYYGEQPHKTVQLFWDGGGGQSNMHGLEYLRFDAKHFCDTSCHHQCHEDITFSFLYLITVRIRLCDHGDGFKEPLSLLYTWIVF